MYRIADCCQEEAIPVAELAEITSPWSPHVTGEFIYVLDLNARGARLSKAPRVPRLQDGCEGDALDHPRTRSPTGPRGGVPACRARRSTLANLRSMRARWHRHP